MDVTNRPPFDFDPECKMLERNYVTCLHEKSLKDQGTPMKCDVERVSATQILWFNVDCPTRFAKFGSEDGLKKAYADWKAGAYAEEE